MRECRLRLCRVIAADASWWKTTGLFFPLRIWDVPRLFNFIFKSLSGNIVEYLTEKTVFNVRMKQKRDLFFIFYLFLFDILNPS